MDNDTDPLEFDRAVEVVFGSTPPVQYVRSRPSKKARMIIWTFFGVPTFLIWLHIVINLVHAL